VVFRTDDRSIHGFTRPVAPGAWRRSIALYYYTIEEVESFAGDHTTYWKTDLATGRRAQLRQRLYRFLLHGSRVFSVLAHRVNPTLDLRTGRLSAALVGSALGAVGGAASAFVALLLRSSSPGADLLLSLALIALGTAAGGIAGALLLSGRSQHPPSSSRDDE
jgi:hypothetical protein